MPFLDNVTSPHTREMYKKAIKHFTRKKMDKNDALDYDYLINEYEQVIYRLYSFCNTLSNKFPRKNT